jgi:hypothetical protein
VTYRVKGKEAKGHPPWRGQAKEKREKAKGKRQKAKGKRQKAKGKESREAESSYIGDRRPQSGGRNLLTNFILYFVFFILY